MPGGHGTGDKPLPLQSAEDLWWTIIGWPVLGGFFMSAPLGAYGDIWFRLGIALLFGGFSGTLAVITTIPLLLELQRRGEWVPPGTSKRPRSVAIVLTILFNVVGMALVFFTTFIVGLFINE
jgi:hypothetical protein